jgi:site-specific DNA-methyltransferase (adenine-specific)
VAHRHGLTGAGNQLWLGDNLGVLAALRASRAGRVDLIIIDPPFALGKPRHQRVAPTDADGPRQVPAFEDTWENGLAGYLAMLEPRLLLMRELLADHGLLIVHVDHRAHPYLRVLLDELFGADLLVNDIVWSYRSGGGSRRRLGCKHDNLMVYARTESHTFNAEEMRVPYDAVIARSRQAAFHPEGKVAGDVWDISRPPNHATEWTGYPTQKPLALVERLVRAFSPADGLVADFFCGSGTTAVAAHRLGRRWLAVDANPAAVHIGRKRLAELGAAFEVWAASDSGCEPTGAPCARMVPEGGGVAVELLDAPGGLDAVDYWAVDFAGDPAGPFVHDWSAGRLGRRVELPRRSTVGPPGPRPPRVLVADALGREWISACPDTTSGPPAAAPA